MARSRSLRVQLLSWIVLPLMGLVVFNAWTAYRTASSTAGLITDHTLLASARAMAEQIKLADGVIEAAVPPAALEMFASEEGDQVFYRITGAGGALIAGRPELVPPPSGPHGFEPVFFDTEFRDVPMRGVAIQQLLPSASGSLSAEVVVAQTTRARTAMTRTLWLHGFAQQAILVVVAGALALFGLGRGLGPLLRARDAVLARGPGSLDPLSLGDIQVELRPLVAALNTALDHVRGQVARHRRFVADASHQLRTPLALLKTQAQVGLRETQLAAKDEALRAVDRGADAMSRLVNQLLTLARAETGARVMRKENVDLAAITRSALERFAAPATAKQIDLGFECEGETVLLGHAGLLHEIVVNLVDNAIRYTSTGGIVSVSLRREAQSLDLSVEDNGPGIAPAERHLVFERFHRVLGSEAEGFGLGLAIVKEAAAAHNGSVSLAEPEGGSGLIVRVRFELA
jgi:two-component system sensor histidine kinase TctE